VQSRLLGGSERFVQIADLTRSEGYRIGDPLPRAAADLGGIRTLLVVPLRKSGTVLGTFGIYRQEVKPFSDRQIALVQSFANQAVIAIENARLFDEARERHAGLARSVDELTATGNVLKINSRSTVDLATVLDRLVETVARLCRGDQAILFRRRDDLYHLAAAQVRPMDFRDHSTAHSGVIALPALIEDRHRPEILHFAAAGLFQRARD
jgi:hypothetical protein